MRRLQLLAVVVIASLFACNTDSRDPLAPSRPSGPMAAVGIDPASGATIETNQDDYLPGELVRVTGHGWALNETVHFDMTEDPDTHGDVTADVQADSAGAFDVPFYDVQDHDLGVTFTLTATGVTSGSKATATFTDGNLKFTTSPVNLAPSALFDRFNGNGTCSGTASASGQTLAYNTGVGLNTGQSIRLTVPTVAGQSYTGYSNPNGLTITPASSSSATVLCITGTSPSSQAQFVLNYVAAKQNQTISFDTPADRTFGDPPFTLSATASSGLAVSYISLTPVACSVAGSTVTILQAGSCTIRASQAGDGGYNPALDEDRSFTIARAAVTATAGSGSGTYTGAVQAPSACVVTGAFTGDLSCVNSPTAAGPDAGTTAISASVSGTGLSNYDITLVDGSYTIARAPSSTSVTCPANVTYNGSAQAPCSAGVTSVGLNQSLVVSYEDNTNAGTATASASYAGDANHEASNDSQTFTIERAPVTATAGSGSGTYDGSAQTPSPCAVTGAYTGDLSCSNSPETVGPGAGTAAISAVVNGTGLSNFAVTTVDGSYTIDKAPLTVTAEDKSKLFDGAPYSPFTAVISGFVNGEDPSVVSGAPGFAGPAVTAVYPGTYGITPAIGSLSAANYQFVTFINATLTIRAWTLSGFYQPVDMSINGTVWNTVKNGSTVPLKFEVFAGSVEQTDVGAVKAFAVRQVACDANAVSDDIELTTTGGTSLRYDAVAGQFIQNWQTPRMAGACFSVTMTTLDNSSLKAYFRLK